MNGEPRHHADVQRRSAGEPDDSAEIARRCLNHFRQVVLSSSNQFSTTISLSGVPARIIKKRRSSGATAYCGPNRRDVNPAAGKSAADRPSENRGLVFMATATRSPEAAR